MKAFHYPQDDINTDLLFPGKYTYTCSTGPEIKEHLLEDLDPEFAQSVEPGDVIIAGGELRLRFQPRAAFAWASLRRAQGGHRKVLCQDILQERHKPGAPSGAEP